MTKPSLFLSQGREALLGSSFRLDSALQAMKPPMPEGMMAASAPPASMRSASPLCMCSAALHTIRTDRHPLLGSYSANCLGRPCAHATKWPTPDDIITASANSIDTTRLPAELNVLCLTAPHSVKHQLPKLHRTKLLVPARTVAASTSQAPCVWRSACRLCMRPALQSELPSIDSSTVSTAWGSAPSRPAKQQIQQVAIGCKAKASLLLLLVGDAAASVDLVGAGNATVWGNPGHNRCPHLVQQVMQDSLQHRSRSTQGKGAKPT